MEEYNKSELGEISTVNVSFLNTDYFLNDSGAVNTR